MGTTTYPTQVAEAVSRAITEAGYTKLGIAEKTGIPRTTLDRRLAGVSPFTVLELSLIADALGVGIAALVTPALASEAAAS